MYSPELNFLLALRDSEDALRLAGIIKGKGYNNVTLVDNGLTAHGLLRAKWNYILILSWDLPGLTALELVDHLRHHKMLKDLPVILTGSPPSKEAMLQARQLKVNAFQFGLPSEESFWPKVEKVIQAIRKETPWPLDTEVKADLLTEQGKLLEAVAMHRQSLDTARQRAATFRTEIGIILMKQNKTQEALEALQVAVTDDPSLARAQSALGQAYLKKNDPRSALSPLEIAFRLDPQNLENQFFLVESLLQVGQEKRAGIFLDRLVNHCQLDQHYFNHLAMAIRKQGQYDQAISIYFKALQRCRLDENLLFNLGRCFAEAGRHDDAREVLKKALELNPEFPQAIQLLQSISV